MNDGLSSHLSEAESVVVEVTQVTDTNKTDSISMLAGDTIATHSPSKEKSKRAKAKLEVEE